MCRSRGSGHGGMGAWFTCTQRIDGCRCNIKVVMHPRLDPFLPGQGAGRFRHLTVQEFCQVAEDPCMLPCCLAAKARLKLHLLFQGRPIIISLLPRSVRLVCTDDRGDVNRTPDDLFLHVLYIPRGIYKPLARLSTSDDAHLKSRGCRTLNCFHVSMYSVPPRLSGECILCETVHQQIRLPG